MAAWLTGENAAADSGQLFSSERTGCLGAPCENRRLRMVEGSGLRVDPAWRQIVRWGGVSLFTAAVVLVAFVIGVFVSGQAMPPTARAVLEAPAVPSTLFVLAAIGELLLMPTALGFYFGLKGVRRAHMLVAAGLMLAAVPMFLGSRGLILSVSRVSGRYLGTASETLKAAYLGSSELALEAQTVLSATGLILLCVSSIIIGAVMLKGSFGGRLGYLVIAAGVITIFSPFAVVMGIPLIVSFIGLVLTASWQLAVGFKLYKLGCGQA